jgi:hypothetical protein
MGWRARGYVGLDREQCIPQWPGIMKYVDEGPRRVQMVNYSTLIEATQLYATEAVQRLEEGQTRRVDGYHRPEAPWS